MLLIYAFVSEINGDLGRGISSDTLVNIEVDGLYTIAGDVDQPPLVEPKNALAFDAVITRLFRNTRALVPARFGSTVRDQRALEDAIEDARDPLERALALVRGRAQMTLRLSGTPAPKNTPPSERPRTGGEYLARKLEEHQRGKRVPELDPIKAVLDRWIVAERTERNEDKPWFASAYHLVDKKDLEDYRATVSMLLHRLERTGVRAKLSGPWAPYAFAPGVFE